MLYEVDCIYNRFGVTFSLTGLVYLEPNTTSELKMREAASSYWRNVADACNKHDMVHHITGINIQGVGEAGGGDDALCGVGNPGTSAVASLSQFIYPQLASSANAMAHELGHHLSMTHDDSNTSFMYFQAIGLACNQYTLSTYNQNKLRSTLQNAACVNIRNVTVNPECTNCDNFVVINSQSNLYNKIEYGCVTDQNLTFDLSSAFANNCVENRNYHLEVTYNDNDIEILETSNNFDIPIQITSPFHNKKIKTMTMNIEKGSSDFTTLKVRVKKGTGNYPTGTGLSGTSMNVNYVMDKPANVRDIKRNLTYNNIKTYNLNYQFEYNYQIDKKGIPVLKASQLTVPDPINPYDFCTVSVKKDIYIDGNFEIDQTQKYCNSNFYFGPNTTIIVKADKTLELEKCLLTTCKDKWKGIVLETGAKLIVNGTTIDNVLTGIRSDKSSSQIQIFNQSVISNFETAIKLEKTRINRFENSRISNGQYGIELSNCGTAFLNNVTISDVQFRGIRSLNTSLFLRTCNITGKNSNTGIGVDLIGSGNTLSLNTNSRIGNWQVGINSIRSLLTIHNSNFANNFIACNQLNSPGFAHDIYSSTFSNGTYGFLSTNSDLSADSYVYDCTFNNLNYGLTISNQSNLWAGWFINSDFANMGKAGVRLQNSEYNYVAGCNLSGRGTPNSSLIRLDGGTVNTIANNFLDMGAQAPEANQVNGIEVNNSISSISCNDATGGSFGFNIWGNSPMYYWQNSASANHTGLHCGLYPSNGTVVMGLQRDRYNDWNNSNLIVGAKHLNDALVFESRFIVRNDAAPQYWPDVRIPSSEAWFTKQQSQAIAHDCWDFNPDNPDMAVKPSLNTHNQNNVDNIQYEAVLSKNHQDEEGSGVIVSERKRNPKLDYKMPSDQIEKYIQKTIPFGPYANEIYANTAWKLYKLNEAGKLNYPGQTSFFQEMANTVGVLYKAEKLIAGASRYSQIVASQNEIREMAKAPNNDFTDGESVAAEQWRDKVGTLSQLYSAARTSHLQDIDQALVDLAALPDMPLPMNNLKSLLQVKAAYHVHDQLNDAQVNIISDIALQCPLSGGDAVYGARAILEGIVGPRNYDDHQLCQPTQNRAKQKLDGSIIVSPNPAYDKITITGHEIHSIRVISPDGKVMIHLDTNGTSTEQMDISSLSPALYTIQVTYGPLHQTQVVKCIKIR